MLQTEVVGMRGSPPREPEKWRQQRPPQPDSAHLPLHTLAPSPSLSPLGRALGTGRGSCLHGAQVKSSGADSPGRETARREPETLILLVHGRRARRRRGQRAETVGQRRAVSGIRLQVQQEQRQRLD